MSYPIANFTTEKRGQNSYAICKEGMGGNSEVSINEEIRLSGTIQFNDAGCVYGITLTGSPGFYDYVINIDAQGPKGFGSGSGYLAFTDRSGDVYKISLYSSTRSVHTLRYNSKAPEIIKIQWSNTSI